MVAWRKIGYLLLALGCAAVLSGCAPTKLEDLYCLPKRSAEFSDLQEAIDGAMGSDMQYSAPRSGDNQQSVQMADLDGDGQEEAILFAKGSDDTPLKILIFRMDGGGYCLADTIASAGSSFDQVEYVQMDGKPGLELVVGRQVSDQVVRNLAVYSFSGTAQQQMNANYTRFLTCDLNGDKLADLFVVRPGETETECGVTELYTFHSGQLEKTVEAAMSNPVSSLNRIMTGLIHDGVPAVFVASLVEGQDAIVTDIYALVDGKYTNVSLSNDSGTSIQTLRNRYLYAEDIDGDGVVELPSLLRIGYMLALDGDTPTEPHIIRWYAMTSTGEEIDKLYTYHNLDGGWYIELSQPLAENVHVVQGDGSGEAGAYVFYVTDPDSGITEKLMTVYPLSGSNREEQAVIDNRFVLLRTDSVLYAARLEGASATYGITRDSLAQSFHLIHTNWKTGVT